MMTRVRIEYYYDCRIVAKSGSLCDTFNHIFDLDLFLYSVSHECSQYVFIHFIEKSMPVKGLSNRRESKRIEQNKS